MIERIVFLDNQEAEEVLAMLDTEGQDSVMEYLKQWHFPGEHETAKEPSAGSADDTFHEDDGYILTWNNGLGYIGLEYDQEVGEKFDAAMNEALKKVEES